MMLYREGHGPDEYEPAEDDEIVEAGRAITKRRLEDLWRGSGALNAGAVLRTSQGPDQAPNAPGAPKTETTEKEDTMADDGGATSALTRAQFEMIREYFEELAPKETWIPAAYVRVHALLEEVERLHPEWGAVRPCWKVTATLMIRAWNRDEAIEAARTMSMEHPTVWGFEAVRHGN